MNKKYISLLLAGIMCFSSAVPAFAYNLDSNNNSIESVEYQNTEDEDYTNKTSVFAELGSEYKVTIPKTIVLSGVDKKANYYVKVEGDIAGYETVNVIPDSSVTLYTKNKDSQTGTITQDKTVWKVSDFDTDANGQVTANGLTAGKWSGTFNFNINLEDTTIPKVLAAGLYDENDNLIKSWDELVELGFDVKQEAARKVLTNNNLSGKLVLPDSVTTIGDFAFAKCASLKSVIIPDSVTTIGESAFYGCTSLTSITIPDAITTIESSTFNYCKSLTSITYNGTKAQWNAIEKCNGWDEDMSSYVVHCTDGDITL